MALHAIDVKEAQLEAVRCMDERGALLTAVRAQGVNTMTIGWYQVGKLWGLPVCTVYVRPERYTCDFVDREEYFTVSVLPEDQAKVLAYCGAHSGREVDKAAECGLTVRRGAGEAPFFEEAELVLVCRKLYTQDIETAAMQDPRLDRYYGEGHGSNHRVFVGEIVEAYGR